MPPSAHTTLSDVEANRDEIARGWLLQAVRQTPFEELPMLPVDRVVRELPELVSRLLRLAVAGVSADAADSLRQLGRELAILRHPAPTNPASAVRDVALLHGRVTEAVLDRSPEEPDATRAALSRLNGALAEMLQAAVAAAGPQVEDPNAPAAARPSPAPVPEPTDPLTGLPGSDHIMRELRHRVELQRRYAQPFAVVVVDLDGLARVNVAFGREAGDAALVRMAEILRVATRAIDTAARVGEDELCLVAPDHGMAGARALAARVQAAGSRIEVANGTRLQVSAAGVACPDQGTEAEALLDAAEAELYSVKAAGSRLSTR